MSYYRSSYRWSPPSRPTYGPSEKEMRSKSLEQLRSEHSESQARQSELVRKVESLKARLIAAERAESARAQVVGPLYAEIARIQNDPGWRETTLLSFLFGKPLSAQAERRITELRARVEEERARHGDTYKPLCAAREALKTAEAELTGYRKANLRYEKAIERKAAAQLRDQQKLVRESSRAAARKESIRKKSAELKRLKSAVAANEGRSRRVGEKLSKSLPATDYCPYCEHSMGSTAHADHIYPISKGGRSTKENMVMVCATCNLRKGEMTLAAFARKFGLDRDAIEQRLHEMGKDI